MLPFSYEMHEMAHFASAPARAFSDVARTWLENPINPLSYTAAGRKLAASAKYSSDVLRRFKSCPATRRPSVKPRLPDTSLATEIYRTKGSISTVAIGAGILV
jgi:poly-beta-hydroxyalkanoate depolymerase